MLGSLQPPTMVTANGSPRRVGVELELGGIELEVIAELVAEVFSGRTEKVSSYDFRVHSEVYGEFRVEADLAVLHESEQEGASLAVRMAAAVGELVAPLEIVAPPVSFDVLPLFDRLVYRLRQRGGEGTRGAMLSAFGAQFNPEAPSLDADSVRRHIAAFALISDWLIRTIDIDVSRRITPFVDPYPRAYALQILADRYRPSMGQLIDDYIEHNPTRNRALDMMPLFCFVDSERVRGAVPDPRIKPRPTYHYRLPDSRVGDPTWTLGDEWQRWLVVEQVAADEDLAAEMAAEYIELMSSPVVHTLTAASSVGQQWALRTDRFLERL